MKNRIYYHIYLDDYFSWSYIFTEQMTLAEKTGLLHNVDKMKISAISKKDNRFDLFIKLCKEFPINIEIEFIENQYNSDFEMMQDFSILQGKSQDSFKKLTSEIPTITKLYNDCQKEDLKVLYLHSKCISSLVNNMLIQPLPSKFKNRFLWRQFMNYGVITNWQKCVSALDIHDTAGIDYKDTPPHYSGNFWWTKSEHVRNSSNPSYTLWWENFKKSSPDPWIQNLSDRFAAEFWLCSKPNTNSFNIGSNEGYFNARDI
jgi:hypothetical protein